MQNRNVLSDLMRLIALLCLFLVTSCRSNTEITPTLGSARGGISPESVCETCPPPYSMAAKFRELQRDPNTVDAGGSEGLVNTVIYASSAWSQMKGASDYDAANSSTNQIRSSSGQVWQKYVPQSMSIFQSKGYNVKYSIDWSTGVIYEADIPQTKLRFTN